MASEVSERIRDVIAAAESAAGAIRHEADQQAQSRRRVAEDDARRLVEDARRDAEALLAERIKRISTLSDTIIERGEALLSQIGHAEEVRRELEALVAALGQSAAQLARDAAADIAAAPSDEETAEPRNPAVEDPPADTSAVEPSASEPETEDPSTPSTEAESADAQVPETEAEPAGAPSADEDSPVEVEVVSDVTIVEDEPREKEEEPAATAAAIEDAVVEDPLADGDDQILGARLVALQMAVAGGNRGEVEAHLRRAFELPDLESILDDVFGPGTDSSKRVVWPSAADA
jgi:hypothetical protein